MDSYALGKFGESIATRYLDKQGISVVYRNYRAKRWGEIDIVGIDHDQTVIVEVKTRRNEYFDVLSSIHKHKIQSLVRTGRELLCEHPTLPRSVRIDVISIVFSSDVDYDIKHYENIYQPSE